MTEIHIQLVQEISNSKVLTCAIVCLTVAYVAKGCFHIFMDCATETIEKEIQKEEAKKENTP